MARGLPKSIIAKYGISKEAWKVYRRGKAYKPVQTRTTGGKHMPRRRRYFPRIRRRRSSGGMTIPLAVVVPLVAQGIDAWYVGGETVKGFADQMCQRIAGISPIAGFGTQWGRMKDFYISLLAGLLIHKFVGGAPLNLNKTLARAKIPLIRI